MWNGKGPSGRVQSAWLLFGCGAMVACGGRSTSSDELQSPDDTTSGSSGGGTSAPSGSHGGFGGGPNLAMLTSACTDVCSRGQDAPCPVGPLDECVASCSSIVAVAEQTAQCATAAIEYLDCMDGLDDICPAFTGATSPCDATFSAATQCIFAICDQRENEVCPLSPPQSP